MATRRETLEEFKIYEKINILRRFVKTKLLTRIDKTILNG